MGRAADPQRRRDFPEYLWNLLDTPSSRELNKVSPNHLSFLRLLRHQSVQTQGYSKVSVTGSSVARAVFCHGLALSLSLLRDNRCKASVIPPLADMFLLQKRHAICFFVGTQQWRRGFFVRFSV